MNADYYNLFDTDPCREGTASLKWDGREGVFGTRDVIPLWVADMDFPTAPAVTDALVARAKHPVYGYTLHPESEKIAECNWLKRRDGLEIDPDWILYSPGVVDSLMFSILAYTKPGDRVLVQPPVYGPFYFNVKQAERVIYENNLLRTEDGWRIDFADMEAALKSGVRALMLCSPHNPVGRVWSDEEVKTTCELAKKYDATLIVDEIHADFILRGSRLTRFLKYADPKNFVMLVSATKTFNFAGLRQSSIIVPDEGMREKIKREIDMAHSGSPNIFGAVAQKAAYESGAEWLDNLVEYISDTRDFAEKYIRENLPEIKIEHMEGTYLMWLDFSSLGMAQDELKRFLYDEAKAGLQDGTFFGEAGRGFMRMNIGTQRKNVAQALENIRAALDRRSADA